MAKKESAPKAPDYGPLIAASKEASDKAFSLGEDQLAWAKQQYASNKDLTDQTTSAFLKSMDFNNENAKADRALYDSTVPGQYKSLVDDANSYNSPERRAQEQGRAEADVGQQFDAQRASAEAQLESYGINPSATRYGALDIGVRTQEAAAKAAASDAAARNVEQTGRDLRTQAISTGMGIAGQAGAEQTAAGNDANAAVANTLATTASGASTMGTTPQYDQIAANDLNAAGGFMNDQYKAQTDAYNAQQSQSSGVGSLLGEAVGIGAKAFGLEKGGAVPVAASPSRGAVPDDVNTALTAGEFVVPKEAVSWLGEKHLHQLVEKAKADRAGAVPAPSRITPKAARAAVPLRT